MFGKEIMKIISGVLLIVTAALFGLFRARRHSLVPWDATSTALFIGVVVGWFLLSRILIGFIDARNRNRKIAGLAGFLVLLIAIFCVAGISLHLKSTFDPPLEFSASFQEDSSWLVVFPFLFYVTTRGKKPANQSLQPTALLGRGWSQTFGKTHAPKNQITPRERFVLCGLDLTELVSLDHHAVEQWRSPQRRSLSSGDSRRPEWRDRDYLSVFLPLESKEAVGRWAASQRRKVD
jgi:hypothetical protein